VFGTDQQLRRWADLVVVAPCSANFLAKLAAGMCDNLPVRPPSELSLTLILAAIATPSFTIFDTSHHLPSNEHSHVLASIHCRTPTSPAGEVGVLDIRSSRSWDAGLW
jgi:hypothetical protein